jgi:anti-sigma factor RsiW
MTTMRFDDETLMAFADGETDDETTAAIEAAIGTDPVLA